MGSKSVLFGCSVYRDLEELRLGDNAAIGHWNWISAARALRTVTLDATVEAGPAVLTLGRDAAITTRHYIDCSGGVNIGAFTVVAGVRSTIMTHQIDSRLSAASLGAVNVGEYCLVSSDVRIVPGSRVPDRSIVAMGSVVAGVLPETDSLYAGVPARRIRMIQDREFFHRTSGQVDIP